MTPIEKMMSDVEWEESGVQQTEGNVPYATHTGILKILGKQLKVYRLNDGRAIIDADDMANLFDL